MYNNNKDIFIYKCVNIGIKIQSRNDYSQWVTSFRVQTSMDHITWVNAKGDNGQEVSGQDEQISALHCHTHSPRTNARRP